MSCSALSKRTSENDGESANGTDSNSRRLAHRSVCHAKALEKHGFKTAAAENGEEGVRKAKARKPDLIFMDIVMPGVNGYQATRMLVNDPETSLIPIIMVTTKGQETDRVWGLRQGAVDYLVKPVSAQALVEKAQAALAI